MLTFMIYPMVLTCHLCWYKTKLSFGSLIDISQSCLREEEMTIFLLIASTDLASNSSTNLSMFTILKKKRLDTIMGLHIMEVCLSFVLYPLGHGTQGSFSTLVFWVVFSLNLSLHIRWHNKLIYIARVSTLFFKHSLIIRNYKIGPTK